MYSSMTITDTVVIEYSTALAKIQCNLTAVCVFQSGGPMIPSVWKRIREALDTNLTDLQVIPTAIRPIVQVTVLTVHVSLVIYWGIS